MKRACVRACVRAVWCGVVWCSAGTYVFLCLYVQLLIVYFYHSGLVSKMVFPKNKYRDALWSFDAQTCGGAPLRLDVFARTDAG